MKTELKPTAPAVFRTSPAPGKPDSMFWNELFSWPSVVVDEKCVTLVSMLPPTTKLFSWPKIVSWFVNCC